ncbi:hypothetical protein BDN70DRAFT_459077 [Pholiota conissans]|uniref:Uncharacterized protein n=1 Tax=Pholiota conissans TaxID=109636 RepID=A0A9P6D6P5_9AGAR|nr:hypothetical protein BDN70DRAFT_459077 [Pholiota conissans]
MHEAPFLAWQRSPAMVIPTSVFISFYVPVHFYHLRSWFIFCPTRSTSTARMMMLMKLPRMEDEFPFLCIFPLARGPWFFRPILTTSTSSFLLFFPFTLLACLFENLGLSSFIFILFYIFFPYIIHRCRFSFRFPFLYSQPKIMTHPVLCIHIIPIGCCTWIMPTSLTLYLIGSSVVCFFLYTLYANFACSVRVHCSKCYIRLL